MSDELKPCPYCGTVGVYSTSDGYYEVMSYRTAWCTCVHKGCILYGAVFTVDAWQNRPIEDALRQRVRELEALVALLKNDITASEKREASLLRLAELTRTPPAERLR